MRNFMSLMLLNDSSEWLKQNSDKFMADMSLLEQILGITQHHDAITGSEK